MIAVFQFFFSSVLYPTAFASIKHLKYIKLCLNLHFKDIFILIFAQAGNILCFFSSLPLYEKVGVFQFICILNFCFPGVLTVLFPLRDSGLSIDEFSRKKLDLTADELSEEKALAYSCLS